MSEEQTATAQLLKSFAPLDGMKRENLAALAKKVSVKTLSAGRVLVTEGDSDKRTLWLVSGELEASEGSRKVAFIRAGSPEARNPLYPNLPRRVTLRSVDDVSYRPRQRPARCHDHPGPDRRYRSRAGAYAARRLR
jgi:CRP-like cAMP-binding protein